MSRNQDADIEDSRDALRLLRAAISFADAEGSSALLYRLAEQTTLDAGTLRKALEFIFDSGTAVFTDGLLPLLRLLGKPELHKPVYRKPLLVVLTDLYMMLDGLVVTTALEMVTNGRIHNHNDKATLIWFCKTLALESAFAREDEQIERLSQLLLPNTAESERFKTVMAGTTATTSGISLAGIRSAQTEVPGGRHDNDHVDFRSIGILPTREEFVCDAEPYLPKAADPGDLTDARLLDRQFRLLREDMLGHAKEEQGDPRKEQRDLFFSARVSHIENGAARFGKRDGKEYRIAGPSDPCICFSFQLPKWHRVHKMKPKDKEAYWERSRRTLSKDALVCLRRQDQSGAWVPVRFGCIKRRETSELAQHFPVVGIAFFNETDMLATLEEFAEQTPSTQLMVVSSSLFTYEPVLKGLQAMDAVSFSEEIVHGLQPRPVQYLRINMQRISVQPDVQQLDPSQRSGLERALTDRVALIQGPPGTGKTHIGVMLAKMILNATEETILCVCYTNHALDAFLEDLLDAGINQIVRMGGRSKSERLAEYNLREKGGNERAPFTKAQSKRYGELKQQIEEAEQAIKFLERQCSREIGAAWWDTVGEFLEDNHRSAWRQLRVEDADLHDEDGFEIQGIKGKDHLWKLWLKGKPPGRLFEDRAHLSLWTLSKDERKQQKLCWQREILQEPRRDLANALLTIQSSKAEIRQLQDMKDTAVLRSAKVIGCTTTKAAMCKQLLDDVSAGVVLVEEAAEIMEAHVLTSISLSCKHLIMIGDHKQLRPKAEHYPLTVESRRGYDLNRSLFERLATILPLSTLGVQHRMHPDISAIPRLITYPELRDAPHVSDQPAVKGLQGRVVFVNHTQPEDQRDKLIDKAESVSKTNQHEVGMVVATVRYLLQQGYRPSDLVVLTPYLGQLLKLQDALSKDFDVLVDDLDFNEARNRLEGVEGFDVTKLGGTPSAETSVRVATIDNYQGEEANVVIISLVRSNVENSIGFLKEPERVNVLLSRAKHGEIIFGNRNTLAGARGSSSPLSGGPLWRTIFQHLEQTTLRIDEDYVVTGMCSGLPVVCQTHGTAAILPMPGDFARNCPEGGCRFMCGRPLLKSQPTGNLLGEYCGHKCTRRCHVGECRVNCMVMVPTVCKRGSHELERPCSGFAPKCMRKVEWQCDGRAGVVHTNSGACYITEPRCGRCANIERLQKELRLKTEEMAAEKNRSDAEMEERELKARNDAQVAEQKKRDFEARKAKALALSKQQIETRRMQREQKAREQHAGEDIDKMVRAMQATADQEVERAERAYRAQLANRARQASEEIDRIERERAADVTKMLRESAEQERQTRELLEAHADALAVDRARNAEERQRVKAEQNARRQAAEAEVARERDELEAEQERLQQQAREQAVVLEQQKRDTINVLRDKRDRERQIAATTRRQAQQDMQAVEDMQLDLAEELHECCICFEQVKRVDGYACDNPTGQQHFVCDECFTGHVKSKMDEDIGLLEAAGAKVFCPFRSQAMGGCDSNAVTDADIFRHAKEGFDSYLRAKELIVERRLGEEIRREERQRLQDEKERVARMDELQRAVHEARQYIVDDIVTLKCPRCQAAFLDFEGCFALRCNQCRCGFCAWCLDDCGEDAHAHVARCPEKTNQQQYHGTKAEFEQHHTARRKRKVRDYLDRLQDDVCVQVVEQCRKDLEDLGMHDIVHEYAVAYGANAGFEAAIEQLEGAE